MRPERQQKPKKSNTLNKTDKKYLNMHLKKETEAPVSRSPMYRFRTLLPALVDLYIK
jgi:hypothetical protein